MPYIRQIERTVLDPMIDEISKHAEHDGQLNYIITRLCHNWIIKVGKKYTRINQIIGVLHCVSMEFYRRVAAPYEDTKIKENGCISDVDRSAVSDYS